MFATQIFFFPLVDLFFFGFWIYFFLRCVRKEVAFLEVPPGADPGACPAHAAPWRSILALWMGTKAGSLASG